MSDTFVRIANQKMDEIATALSDQFGGLHVGRAQASMVTKMMVEVYGSKLPLDQVASVTTPEANQILIAPWDRQNLQAIETAIREDDQGFQPVNDGQAIRIILPALTEERRTEIIKIAGKMAEEARIALRNVRHETLDEVSKQHKAGVITDDASERIKKDLDKLIGEMNDRVETLTAEKEKQLMRV